MTLQNRVDPFGEIHAAAPRGLFTGNRGIIHDPLAKTLLKKRWTNKAWIICALEWKGVRREPMARRSWTELFFADEVTALAAGHRPCFLCRREQAAVFLAQSGARKTGDLDARLHGERLASGGKPVAFSASALSGLPDGAMIAASGEAYAMKGGMALPWSFSGYGAPVPEAMLFGPRTLITPAATLAILRAGYAPVWHPSAAVTSPA